MLAYLQKQGRIFCDSENADTFYDKPEMETDAEILSAICVLCDFAERVEFHSAGEYPVKLVFFADGELYDVIVVPRGKESLVSCAVREIGDESKRIVIVEEIEQSDDIDIPNAVAFCTVDEQSGEVEYYKLEE